MPAFKFHCGDRVVYNFEAAGGMIPSTREVAEVVESRTDRGKVRVTVEWLTDNERAEYDQDELTLAALQ